LTKGKTNIASLLRFTENVDFTTTGERLYRVTALSKKEERGAEKKEVQGKGRKRSASIVCSTRRLASFIERRFQLILEGRGQECKKRKGTGDLEKEEANRREHVRSGRAAAEIFFEAVNATLTGR